MAVQFGVVRDSGTYGIVQSMGTTETAEVETYQDADGDVAGYQEYNESEDLSMEFVYDSTLPPPTAGNTITINTNNYVATEVKDGETNTGFRTVSITGKRWLTNTVPA